MAKTPLPSADPLNLTLDRTGRTNILEFARNCARSSFVTLQSFRNMLKIRDQVYQRQLNLTAKQLQAIQANMRGDPSYVADVTVPIVMPQVESAVAYQAGVFLSSTPIFGVVASADKEDMANQFELVLQQQAQRFGWSRELIKIFRNGFKYNFGPAVINWRRTPVSKITNSQIADKVGLSQIQSDSFAGNQIKALDPYNCFMDTRVSPANIHTDGEFFGYNEMLSRIQLKRLIQELDPSKTQDLREAYESSYTGNTVGMSAYDYYLPIINKYLNVSHLAYYGTNWMNWAGLENGGNNDIAYRDHYLVTHFYCRACPSDFGGRGNIPQVYRAIIINWRYVVFVERIIAAHDYLPTVVMQPNEDGLAYQTQSMVDNSMPFQDMSSALWNISLEASRRRIYDRLVYNPNLINKKDIDPADPISRIPLKNAALFQGDIARAIYQIPYRDDGSQMGVQHAQLISQMADEAVGQNKVARGQFQKGNKTTAEFDRTMDGADSRQQLAAICIEHQFFTPVKDIVKANTLQNQGPMTVLDQEQKQEVNIDPVQLRNAILEFTITDGVLPTDKLLSTDVMQVFMQTAQAMPVLASQYDVMSMFLYWCKLKGATWVNQFKNNPAQQQQFISNMQQVNMASDPNAQAKMTQIAAQAQQQAQQPNPGAQQ